jgi:peptidoglycan/xylan/chitin deacetylase (PgdA/CDA1 family)
MPSSRKLLTRKDILRALERLSEILDARGVKADLFVVGGAAMTLAYKARPSTRDVDAIFKRKNEVFKAAAQVAREQTLPDEWLSDAAKKFIGRPDRRPRPILDLPGVRVMAGSPEYLLAMKVLADRHDRDRDDLRFLIRLLGLKSMKQAEKLFSEVYPTDEIPEDTRARLAELIAQEAIE